MKNLYAQCTQRIVFILFGLIITTISHAKPADSYLVSTEWLAAHLNDDLVIIDMSDAFQYQRFHIPNAINIPYSLLNKNDKGVSLSIGGKTMVQLLGQIGISRDTPVVLYDDSGGLSAARLFWELQRLQHPKVSMLDGGLVKWIREGRKIEFNTKPKLRKAVQYQYSADNTSATATATLADIKAQNKSKSAILLDVRSKEEYVGHPKYPRSGHIPQARWWEWENAVDFAQGFTQKQQDTLLQSLAKAGIKDKNQEIITYCRSGRRAAQTYFTLRNLGFTNVKLYDGSMKEYEQIKNLPLQKGLQP